MNLFIIGNGFDLAHGLPTKYKNFRNYLQEVNWNYLESLENMYGFCINSKKELVEKYLWEHFETNLSNIDESIIENGEYIDLNLESGDIGIEDTLYDYWEEQYKFIKKLNDFIMSWIKQINIINVPRLTNNITSNDLFITFNYTLLLEKVYNIDPYNILHIHGSIDEDDYPPVIGHGNRDKIIEAEKIYSESCENYYEKSAAIYKAISNYYRRTLKDVPFFIFRNKDFFKRLKNIESISIIGHSLGDVDMPYFKEIYENVDKNTTWNIYYHDENEKDTYKKQIMSIGVNENNISILKSDLFFR